MIDILLNQEHVPEIIHIKMLLGDIMLARKSCSIYGLESFLVDVEVIFLVVFRFDIVGLLDPQ